MSQTVEPNPTLITDLLAAFDQLFGLHPGFRPAHAKGAMCAGTFTPARGATALTRAPHVTRPSTPVMVRLSDFAGIPTVADNDPNAAGPRGMGIRFYLAAHSHTDIIAHSADGFPTRTGEEFLAFARAAAASGSGASKPTPIESFIAAHPAARRFAELPKPIPSSFAHEAFFGVSAYRFTNAEGASRYGRYRIRPAAGTEYLSPSEAAQRSANFLFDELGSRLAAGPVSFRIAVQIANPGDVVDDATVSWPNDRVEMDFGTIELTKRADDSDPEMRKIILDPIPRVDGIEPSDDPLHQVRAALYLMSGRRRRAATRSS